MFCKILEEYFFHKIAGNKVHDFTPRLDMIKVRFLPQSQILIQKFLQKCVCPDIIQYSILTPYLETIINITNLNVTEHIYYTSNSVEILQVCFKIVILVEIHFST